MEFLRRAERPGRTLALLPGSWNPPTRAHAALAAAALGFADEAVFILPGMLPHKSFEGPSPSVRMEWIAELSRQHPAYSAAVTAGGLFMEMAREARQQGASRVLIVCGADAAERIATWPYPPGSEIEGQLEADFELLVAPRLQPWLAPAHLAPRVHTLPLEVALQEISSTRIRELIRSGGSWEHLVPDGLAEAIRAVYVCS